MASVTVSPEYAVAVLEDWLSEPETQRRLRDAASRGIARAESAIFADPNFRIPRRPDLRAQRFAVWLNQYRTRIEETIAIEVNREFPFIRIERAWEAVRIATEQTIPELSERFQRVLSRLEEIAVRGNALPWVADNIGDRCRLGVGQYDPVARLWRVPLLLPEVPNPLAFVEVNGDGEVVSDAATIREQVRAAL
jgi:hypothetical protein